MLTLSFSERQKSIIAAALTTLSLVAIVVVVVWLAKAVLAFFVYFSGVFLPLAVASILATLMKPFYERVRGRLKNRTLSLAIVILSLVVPLAVLLYYYGVMILGQISSFLADLPLWVEKIQHFIEAKMPAIQGLVEQYDLRDRLETVLQGRSEFLASSAAAVGQGVFSTGSAIFSTVAGLLSWAVMPIYFVFLIQAPALRREGLEAWLPFLRPETRKDAIYLATEFVSILVSFFRGQLVVALGQGVLFSIGFALVGLPHGIILGLTLGFLNIVPYLGNIIGLAVVIPLAWFHPEGGVELLAGVGLVFIVVQSIEGYVLTPRIMGQTTGLHPMAIIFAILFWGTALDGLLGMILAIPLTAFLVVFWRLLKSTYIKEWI